MKNVSHFFLHGQQFPHEMLLLLLITQYTEPNILSENHKNVAKVLQLWDYSRITFLLTASIDFINSSLRFEDLLLCMWSRKLALLYLVSNDQFTVSNNHIAATS